MPDSRLNAQTPADLDTVKGWFFASDRRMFAWLLDRQRDQGQEGDLVELGCYLGKSAILIGDYVRPEETFTVLDLFESEASDASNAREMQASYSTLAEAAFAENYLRFHPELPQIVKGLSSEITDHVKPGSCRFIHIDASHLYPHVATDVDSARLLLQENGVVAFDDYRAEHCPGVAAAVWEAVFTKGMRPICVTEGKLYATWGDPQEWQEGIEAWLQADPLGYVNRHEINGLPVLRTKAQLPRPPEPPKPAPTPQAAPKPAPKPTPPPRTGARKVAKEWLPPKLHQAVSRQLGKRR